MPYKLMSGEVKTIEAAGTGRFVMATMGVIDYDGDVIEKGAFGHQDVPIVPAHDWQHVPIGKGVVSEVDDQAVVDFRLNLKIPAAAAWHEAIKFDLEYPPALQEYSFGYEPTEYAFGEFEGEKVRFLKKVKVSEASPVLKGAGIDTRTLLAKSRGDLRFADQAGLVVAALAELLDRADDVVASRREKGKHLGSESSSLLLTIEGHIKRLDALLRAPDPNEELTREYLRAVARDLALTS